MSHTTIYVLDQEEAYDFYVNKLGLEVRTDDSSHGGRWLTVGPKGQPDLEIVLMPTHPSPMMDEEKSRRIRELVQMGAFGAGVFETPDCRKAYEELSAKGVEFMGEPQEQFYGVEALMRDNSGNWFSLTQRKH